MMKNIDLRLVPPILISLILATAHFSFGILRGWEAIATAIGTAIVVELIIGRLYWGSWPHPASAYTSGISVGILVRSPLLWPFALCSALSIASKYVLRVNDRHIWNPSNFGLCAVFLLAPYAVAPLNMQWGNNLWPMLMIWVVGMYVIWKVKRFHITGTYIVAFIVLSFVRSFITGDTFMAEVAPLTGPMYQLFALFMITDPVTTVSSKRGEIVVTVIIAVVELFLRLGEVVYAPFYALFIVGPLAMLAEMWWNGELFASAGADEAADPETAAQPAT
jgi:Na+-translocating ferredoxin:NAD+ oxidoreductase RnfD subunit